MCVCVAGLGGGWAEPHLKGRKPPTTQCAQPERYHGMGGISRAMFLVRHGASKLPAQFLPKMPPITVSGYPTEAKTEKRVPG